MFARKNIVAKGILFSEENSGEIEGVLNEGRFKVVLVWVDPIAGGGADRSILNAMLRRVALASPGFRTANFFSA